MCRWSVAFRERRCFEGLCKCLLPIANFVFWARHLEVVARHDRPMKRATCSRDALVHAMYVQSTCLTSTIMDQYYVLYHILDEISRIWLKVERIKVASTMLYHTTSNDILFPVAVKSCQVFVCNKIHRNLRRCVVTQEVYGICTLRFLRSFLQETGHIVFSPTVKKYFVKYSTSECFILVLLSVGARGDIRSTGT